MGIYGIDHLVLTVRDIEETCAFYERVLGAEVRTFGEGRTALHFGDQKINLHPASDPYEPRAAHAAPGTGDFCLLTDEPIDAVAARLDDLGVPIEVGPTGKTGANGPLRSIYVRDPDRNLVEIAAY